VESEKAYRILMGVLEEGVGGHRGLDVAVARAILDIRQRLDDQAMAISAAAIKVPERYVIPEVK